MSCSLSLCTLLILLSLVCYPVIPFVSCLSFDISSFDTNQSDILLEGGASTVYGSVELTSTNALFPYFQVGRIQYSKPIYIWDSVTGRQADFSTRFSFTINTNNATQYSDGLAFFLAPVGFPIPPNSGGGYLGLFNESTSDAPQNQIVMVEFDTWVNPEFDPPMQHIGINKNSLKSLVHAGWNAGSHSGNATNVMVTYDSTSKNLSVFWSFDDKPVSPDNKSSSLSCQIDLAKLLPESVAIGFSAAYGLYAERHSINSWEFTSNLDVLRPPSTDTSKKGVKYKMYRLITFITVPVACLLLVISGGSCLFMIKMRKKYQYQALSHIDKEIVALPLQFSYQELLVATKGFANDQRLGQGGSSQVYKGYLNRLSRRQKNLCSIQTFREGLHQRSEDNKPHDTPKSGAIHWMVPRGSLPWDVRYKIASGLALALNYLHEDLEQCILHRDIKAASILLDSNFNTKLGDFGVAKLVDPQFRTHTTDVVGTYGYLAPEYLSEGKVTKGSDMFSFGVVALEIACGRRTYQEGECHVPLYKWVWQLYLARNILEAADETLGSSFDRKEMECLIMLGLWCVHPDPKRRPKAGQVIRFLQQEVPVPELPPGTYEAPTSYQPSAQRIELSSIEGFSSSSSR